MTWRNEPSRIAFFFLLSGGTGFALYLLVSNGAHYVFGAPIFLAAAIGTLLPVPVTFWMQRTITFRSNRRKQLPRYLLLQIANAIFIALLSELGDVLRFPAVVVFVVAGATGVVASYVVQAKVIFPVNSRRYRLGKVREISAQYSTMKAGSVPDKVAARMRRVMFQRFLAAGVTPTDTILDVGATSDDELEASNYLEAWYPHKDRITACGIDDAHFLEERFPGVRFVKIDGRALPFADDAFDVVHASAVLEHVGSRERQYMFIAELTRVARRLVFLTTPNRWFPIEFHTALPLVHWLPAGHFRALLRMLGHDALAREENLNLMGAGELRRLCGPLDNCEVEVGHVSLAGWPSNLLLTIRKARHANDEGRE